MPCIRDPNNKIIARQVISPLLSHEAPPGPLPLSFHHDAPLDPLAPSFRACFVHFHRRGWKKRKYRARLHKSFVFLALTARARKKGLGFDPSSIHPLSGDTIVFEFRSGSHSVVQSTFDNPCTSNGGFNSGVLTVDDNLGVDADGLPTVSLLVNDTQPLWYDFFLYTTRPLTADDRFFDDAGGLCNKGAVLSVNPTADQSDAQFKANAASATTSSSSSAVASTTISDSATVSASASQTPAPSGSMAQLGIVPELYVAFLALVSGLSLVV
ncbi:hypothetical protein C8F01DRAFT_305970 [Mycena amicta]|nr:hypothetical protein C8F01DRAFT_305970 [Mycena amicta]